MAKSNGATKPATLPERIVRRAAKFSNNGKHGGAVGAWSGIMELVFPAGHTMSDLYEMSASDRVIAWVNTNRKRVTSYRGKPVIRIVVGTSGMSAATMVANMSSAELRAELERRESADA